MPQAICSSKHFADLMWHSDAGTTSFLNQSISAVGFSQNLCAVPFIFMPMLFQLCASLNLHVSGLMLTSHIICAGWQVV
jgi:hypothetical protein